MVTPDPAGPLRDGFALVLSMLMVTALAVLSAGMLIVAGQEASIAAAATSTARARAAAEADVRRTLATWSTRREAALPIGSTRSLDPQDAKVTIRRLDSTLFLVTARATSSSGTATVAADAGVLVRTLDTARIHAAAASAAVVADSAADLVAGAASGLDACGTAPALTGVLAPAVHAGAATLEGAPPLATATPPPDPLAGIPLHAVAEVVPAAPLGSPAPAAQGDVCVPDQWNWGTARPGHPCAEPVLIHSAGDLTVAGGEGFGVLVVDGDFTVTGGFVFHGFIQVRGRLVLVDGHLSGAVRAHHLHLRGGDLRYDACALARAFDAHPFDRPFRSPGRWWVPVF
ncbi:MAG TPA: hypothetical protein VMM12_13375 [Longimicrobiales bacterium]|nr:hypothetical protein [Longimicrobiales bacterium]